MGEGFPLWSLASMAWEEREPLRDWICLSLFLRSQILVLHCFFYIRRSLTLIGVNLSPDFSCKISFLAAKEERKPPYGYPTRVQGAPRGRARPLSRGHLGHRFVLILPPKNPKYSKKNLRQFLFHLHSVWYGFSEKQKTCNKHELALGTGSIC